MADKKKLPVGIDIFEKLISNDFYYVDKTAMIISLLKNWSEVNLFTRPRRFGKSLNMTMLKAFFEIGTDPKLFDGLKISEEKELCQQYMGKFPVIFLSLKGVEGRSFEDARYCLIELISREAMRFRFLLDSDKLSEEDKGVYKAMISRQNGRCTMDEKSLALSLQTLSELLYKYYGQKTVILLDEYDVPLDKAFQYGFYNEMVLLIRTLFGNALKTNPYLQFAVLTGCLRIAKESIFTGLNNFKVLSILNSQYDEYFGFTNKEVKEMLEYYGLSEHYEVIKEWYDGYVFGQAEVYCPWDVINYCDLLRTEPDAYPENYWANTSGNAIVRRFIDKADAQTRKDIERLIAGEEIEKEIHQELTYNEIDKSIDNLWSVLFTTGYLTHRGRVEENRLRLAIPNREVRNLFISQIREWFKEEIREDASMLSEFCDAFPNKDAEKIEELFGDYLWKTISIRDTASSRKENFYHGILLGLLAYKESWLVLSNAESGIGYSDILIEIPKGRIGVVIELKYAERGKLEEACKQALSQIEEKDYEARLIDDGMKSVIKYGIACYKKNCRVECRK